MKIILEYNNFINPFSSANIYEKQKKEDINYNKYYKQSFINELKSGYLEQYFT